jgi:concanavalin A-like lectin/glucanase superfamily protein
VGFWNMSSPGSSEADLTGRGRSGTYKGGTPTLATMPNGDKAADFNGAGQYMTIASSPAFSITTTKKLTWEAWIRPDTLQFPDGSSDGYVDFMGKCASYSPTCEWEGRMYSSSTPQGRCNRVSAYVFNPGAGLGSGADWQPKCGLIQAGQWLHVVGEYQTLSTPSPCNAAFPGTIDIWVNGVKWSFGSHAPTGCMSQYSIKPVANSSPVNIGAMAMEYFFSGAVGKVAIYDYLLSSSQISAHYTAMTGKQPSGSCAATCTFG